MITAQHVIRLKPCSPMKILLTLESIIIQCLCSNHGSKVNASAAMVGMNTHIQLMMDSINLKVIAVYFHHSIGTFGMIKSKKESSIHIGQDMGNKLITSIS